MQKNDSIFPNPLKTIGYETKDVLREGEFGAVLARPGVGKTSFLVQLALNALVKDVNVLHISLNDPVNKVRLWYKEMFHHLASPYNSKQINQLWESILPHRFIMAFNAKGFQMPVLEKRLADLKKHAIFLPQMVIIDGLLFDESMYEAFVGLKTVAVNHSMHIWFTISTHRHEKSGPNGIPVSLLKIAELFEIIIKLKKK